MTDTQHQAEELKFVRTPLIQIIPRRLFEQIKDRVFDAQTIDRIYQFGPEITAHPAVLLFALVNDRHEIHGVLWAQIDPFESDLSVYVFSVDPEYQDGHWPERAAQWLFDLPLKWENLKPYLTWTTTRPETFALRGAVLGPNVQMVISREAFLSQRAK